MRLSERSRTYQVGKDRFARFMDTADKTIRQNPQRVADVLSGVANIGFEYYSRFRQQHHSLRMLAREMNSWLSLFEEIGKEKP